MSSAISSDAQQQANSALAQVLRDSSGFELGDLNRQASFLELGFDSLFLIQLSQRLKRTLGVKVAFRQLIEDVSTIDALVDYLAANAQFKSPANAPQSAGEAAQAVVANSAPPAQPPIQPAVANPRPPQPVADVLRHAPTVAATNALPSTPPAPLVPTVAPPPAMPVGTVPATAPIAQPLSGSGLEQLIAQQNALMARHLDLLLGQAAAPSPAAVALDQAAQPAVPPAPGCGTNCESGVEHQWMDEQRCTSEDNSSASPDTATDANADKRFERFGPYKPVRRGANNGLTEQQQTHLNQFIERYTSRTKQSKLHAEAHRDQFADPRGVAGYRRVWKSMVYQIAVERSQGSKLWDVDGNEYVDIAMGFGLNLFGQSPEFVTRALHQQLDRGVEVGPQSPLAGEVASLLCEFSRQERVTFCNTGSEAVMAALRLARTVNGKTKTVFFNKDYHGNFDQVLLRSRAIGNRHLSSPAAPGVPDWYSDNTLVLDYGTPEALRIIEEEADDIAAVLIEPVQSADPFIQPREFLQEVRRITREHQIAMIMDEVITGFRAAQGGAQEWFGVWGDMATYGKVLGGGMPIGALAGSAEYMNALDGGTWRYDGDSEPDADMTFFAGTFVRHPLAIAAAYEVLKEVKEQGPEMQQRLTDRTTYLVETLNRFFERELFPIRVAQFTSLFRFMFPPDLEYADMLYFHLLDRGIFTRGWGDNCFLSTAHSDEDIERVIRAVQESCLEIREGGFFPEPDTAPTKPSHQTPADAPQEPVADSQADSPSVGQHVEELVETRVRYVDPESAGGSAIASNAPAQGLAHSGVDQEELPNSSSDRSVAIHLADSDAPDRLSTLIGIQEAGTRPPLFCMPAADGLTLVYHELAECLGPDQPVYGLNSPGVYREPIPDTLEELASRFIEDIRELQPSGPYLLIGYCSGGTTALEVARQLRQAGEQIALVGCLESYNWLTAPSTEPTLRVQAHYQYERVKYHCLNFMLLNNRQKIEFLKSKFAALRERLQVWRGWFGRIITGSRNQRGNTVNMSDIWRKHDAIAEAYVPRKYPGHLLQIRPRRDYKCHIGEELEATELEYCHLDVYPAGMMVQPFVNQLAQELKLRMDRGLARCASAARKSG